jgi:hypothetical protein
MVLELAGVEEGAAGPGGEDARGGLLSAAREGSSGTREIAFCGTEAGRWPDLNSQGSALFSAFAGEWSLAVFANPEASILERTGAPGENLAAEHPEVVAQMRQAAIKELMSRGLPEEPARWLAEGGPGTPDPDQFRVPELHTEPEGYASHWTKMYRWADY